MPETQIVPNCLAGPIPTAYSAVMFKCIQCEKQNTAERLKKGFAACSKSCELAFRRGCRENKMDADLIMRMHRDMAARIHGDQVKFVGRGSAEIKRMRAEIVPR